MMTRKVYIAISFISTWVGVLKSSDLNVTQDDKISLTLQPRLTDSIKSKDEKDGLLPEAALKLAMKSYNKIIKPKGAVEIQLNIHVLSFDNLEESSMKYKMDFYFAQYWYDERLKVSSMSSQPSINIVGKKAEDFWLPDTVFVNSKSSTFHSVTVENRFITINLSSGMILYHARISTTASCHMDFRKYPFDIQTCYLAIESYGHDNNELVYKWYLQENSTDESYSIVVYDKEMASFDVTSATKSLEKTPYHEASFSSATAKFTFRRRREFFILQIYLPCALIVAVTWVSFWIVPTAIPARSGICVTAILTLITMLSITNANMPKVGYIKALDLYLFSSFVFVFLALIEYIIVLNWSPKKKQGKTNKKREYLFVDSQLQSDYILSDVMDYSKQIQEKADFISDIVDYSKGAALFYKQLHKRNICKTQIPDGVHVKCESRNLLNEKLKINFSNRNSTCPPENECIEIEISPKDEQNFSSSTIDYASRFVFPISFFSFNFLYWWFFYFRE